MTRALDGPGRIDQAYDEHRRYVFKVLSRRCGWMGPDEIEEVFHESYLVLLERERDGRLGGEEMAPAQVRAFLTQTAINKALDEGKSARRARSVSLEAAELTVADEARAPEDVASAGLEGARVREIVSDLSERKRAIVKLRFFFERSPGEIQQFLGISERVYRRELERAMRQIEDGYELVRDGSYCDSRRSGIIALISGIAGPGRAKAAREHLATCPGCSAWAAQMRDAARKVGAFVPLPPLYLERGPLERLWEAIEGVRDGLTQAGASTKQHAAGLAARADQASAGMLGGARPGAAAALVVGCLAVGGGATYCAVNGLPGPLGGASEPNAAQAREAERPERAAKTTESPPPATESPVSALSAESAATTARKAGKSKAEKRREKKRQQKKQKEKARAAKAAQVKRSEPAPEAVEELAEPVEEVAAAPEEEFSFEGEPAPPPPPPPPPPTSSGGEFAP